MVSALGRDFKRRGCAADLTLVTGARYGGAGRARGARRFATQRLWVVAGAAFAAVALMAGVAVASFADSTPARSTAITTATVDPPTNVTIRPVSCRGRDVQIAVSWSPSGTPGVSGYVATAYFNDGTSQALGQVDAGTTSTTYTSTVPNGATIITVAVRVTTMTTYGWTATSPISQWVTC